MGFDCFIKTLILAHSSNNLDKGKNVFQQIKNTEEKVTQGNSLDIINSTFNSLIGNSTQVFLNKGEDDTQAPLDGGGDGDTAEIGFTDINDAYEEIHQRILISGSKAVLLPSQYGENNGDKRAITPIHCHGKRCYDRHAHYA